MTRTHTAKTTHADGRPIVGRLAPSPTGVLHLGNARTFLLAWLSARGQNGRLFFRLEDIDGPRTKAGAGDAAAEDLRWLGLDWDGDVVVQSGRLDIYRQAAGRLVAARKAYPCVCTRKEVEDAASAPHESGADGPVYPGTCRDRWRSIDEARAASGREPALRFLVDRDHVPFHDGFRGPENGAIAGDFVIMKRDGGPAYQLAVVVDDIEMGITEVVRADDLLPSTPRQLLIYEALGARPPAFLHPPLVVGKDGLRLAKRHGDTSLAHFRRAGVTPDRLVGYVASLAGLCAPGERVMPRDLLARFDWSRVPRTPVVGEDHRLLG